MMKKSFKNRSAVSPVIATILMVAITVVLAAVLYVMVMGFGSGPSSAPTVSLTKSSTDNAHEEKILISSITEPVAYANMKVSIVVDGAAAETGQVASGAIAAITGADVTFVDIAADGKVGSGDYFLVGVAGSGSDVVLNLLYGADSVSIGSSEWIST